MALANHHGAAEAVKLLDAEERMLVRGAVRRLSKALGD